MNLLGQTGPFAKAGRLIVTIAATAADPTGLSAAGAILDAYQTAHDALTNDNPDLAKLAKELGRDLENRLTKPTFHRPKNADTLLPQMIEIALPRSEDFPDTALDPNAMITCMLARLTESAHCTPAIQDAFRALYLPVLTKATNDPRMLAALQPAIQRKLLHQNQTILDAIAAIPPPNTATNTANLDLLMALAAAFGAPVPATKPNCANSCLTRPNNWSACKPAFPLWNKKMPVMPICLGLRATPLITATSNKPAI